LSGTGKSTALAELARGGFATVETDVEPWSEWSDEAGGYVWNEQQIADLLDREHETTLFVSGTVSNQGRFYDRFDAVVLLSAPPEVLLERIAELLASPGESPLYVSGCVSNQGRFYDRFEAVVLLSAPPEVILERIGCRSTNDFGKSEAERERILADLAAFEPRLRETCTHELDATRPLAEIVEALAAIGRS
jgi:dephospho-CoA kinase